VILDGRYIGTADDFDGFPDYLYLGRGKYRIEFVLEGFETKVVDIDARPGTMTKIDDKLHKIPGAKQYGSYNTPEPEGGVQRYFVKHGDKSSPETGPGPEQYESQPPPDQGSPEGDEPPPQEAPPPRPVRSAPSSAPAPPSPSSDWRDHPQGSGSGSVTARPAAAPSTRLNVKAEPADAAVYLDDRFIGTAEELSGMVRGVRVSPGRHRVTVSRPGYAEKTVEVEIETGTTGSVDVELQR
jgi:hypothetical protein